jgi:hypothetical protein
VLTLVFLHALKISCYGSPLDQISALDVVLEVRKVGDGSFPFSKVIAESESSCFEFTSVSYSIVREDRTLV